MLLTSQFKSLWYISYILNFEHVLFDQRSSHHWYDLLVTFLPMNVLMVLAEIGYWLVLVVEGLKLGYWRLSKILITLKKSQTLQYENFEGFHPFTPNSPYCLLYNSHKIDLENLILDQLMIHYLIFFFILNTSLLDFLLILWGENLSWSLM